MTSQDHIDAFRTNGCAIFPSTPLQRMKRTTRVGPPE